MRGKSCTPSLCLTALQHHPTALFSEAKGHRPAMAGVSRASGTLAGTGWVAQGFRAMPKTRGCSGSLLLRPSGLRATPDLWQCPGRLPGREQCSCSYMRGRTRIHREAAGSMKGMADALQLLSGDPVREGLGKLVKEG